MGWTTIAMLGQGTGPAMPPPPDAACAMADGGDIAVCGRRAWGDRYRLPRLRDRGFDPSGPADSVLRVRGRLMDAGGDAPDLTRGSCGATGASGATGRQVKAWREADQRRGG